MSKFTDLGLNGYRGGILVGSTAYVAIAGKVLTVSSGGVVANAGNLPGTDMVSFARDNEKPNPSIQVVSPANGAFAVTSSSVTSFNSSGNLPQPNCVAGQDGYFFWGIGDNRVFAAGPNSTAVNALTFITVQSRPTGTLLRIVPYQGLLLMFTSTFFEAWSDTANPFPGFPYSRYAVIDRGLIGRNAIAGWEDGFGALHWVGDDGGVYRLNGTAPFKVSPPDLDRLILAVTPTDNLVASCYVEEGKSFWVLSSPTWTWEFCLNTQKWNERQSYNNGLYQAWRSVGSFPAFGKWLTGDNLSTNLLQIDSTTQQEVGKPLVMRMESGPCSKFPNRTMIARADFNFVTGTGISSGTTSTAQSPQVGISMSRDGGYSWVGPRLRQMGAEGKTRRRVYAMNWGQSTNQGARWRIEIADEVYASFMGATMSSDPRAA